ncbi:uncharacterized protein At5g65660-like [Aristolochia californica]|uniref:uncharacterized protein At5g65660-like n=1 Tax=Aristolochia californica TaxID=171875 RepID=UPI0035D6391A
MDSQDLTGGSGHQADASHPALGFPLGTALLLIVIFCLSGIFSCCYHWDKLRSLRRAFSGDSVSQSDSLDPPVKPAPLPTDPKPDEKQSLPVLMPGDRIPKYIAWPSPCEPSPLAPPTDKILTVEIQSPPLQPPRPS